MISKTANSSLKKFYLFACISIDIGILFAFKYLSFALSNLILLTNIDISIPEIVLPVGISFYTFQGLSYVIDVYNGSSAEKNPFYLSLYLSFFPQLIAGPIVRYTDISEQIRHRSVSPNRFTGGVRRFCIGLSKKVILANHLGEVSAFVFDNSIDLEFCSPIILLGAISYMLQIYLDFSAYSDMAIGLGNMFGFSLPENFDIPYLAGSATEFWRRWHMTLSRWFRDYVYIPLGGSRKTFSITIRNLLTVWLLTGIWHGAGWNYIIWGMMWFILIVAERFVFHPQSMSMLLKTLYRIFLVLFIVISWIIFRTQDIGTGADLIVSIFDPAKWSISSQISILKMLFHNYCLYLIFGLLVSLGTFARVYCYISDSGKRMAVFLTDISLLAMFVLSVSFLVGSSYNPFLYFQF